MPIHYVVASRNEISTPLKQNWIATDISGIKCKDGFQLIGKRENGSPACVMPATFVKIIVLKWGYDPFQDGWSFNGLNNSYKVGQMIPFTVQFKGFSTTFCYLPIVTLKDVNDNSVWNTGYGLYLCKQLSIKDAYYFEQNETVNIPAINQTGSYTIVASWTADKFLIMQKNITITS
jgi:hypothetical protein